MLVYKDDNGMWFCAFYYKDWTGALKEVANLKNRTLWQLICADMKLKSKSNCYGRRYKWKEVGKKVLDVVLSVGYAMAVYLGVWWVMNIFK